MCLERVRPLGSCLVTFPDSFTAQEGWRERGRKKVIAEANGGLFCFFSTATGSVTAPDSVCISSSCFTTLKDSSPTGNSAEQREKTIDRRIMSIGQSCLLLLVWNQFILDLSSVGCLTWIRTQGRYCTACPFSRLLILKRIWGARNINSRFYTTCHRN